MRETTVKKIIDYFNNNEDLFNSCMEELDSYNGYLGDNCYYSMDELDEFYNAAEPLKILRRAYYGRDDDTYTTDSNRDYFYYNGYGNLVSCDYKDYTAQLDKYAVEAMSENRQYIGTIENNNELNALFDELEQDENEEE